MLMAVDVGNTQTVLGLIDGGEPRGQWRIATEAHRTADELAVFFVGLLALEGLSPDEVSAMIVSSVVPGLTRSYRNLASGVFGVPYYGVTAEMETGLDNRYDDPEQVGADRIVNAVAAGRHYGFPAIIVDIGTATTVEAVDGEACYLGCAILTGLYVSLDALVSKTAKLPSVDLEEEPCPGGYRGGPDQGELGYCDAREVHQEAEGGGAEPDRSRVRRGSDAAGGCWRRGNLRVFGQDRRGDRGL